MTRSFFPFALAPLVLIGCNCDASKDPEQTVSRHWSVVTSLGERGKDLSRSGDDVLAAVDGRLLRSSDGGDTWSELEALGLAPGTVHFVHILPDNGAEDPVFVVSVFGEGVFRSVDGGASFQTLGEAPSPGLMSTFNPRARVLPFGMAGDSVWGWMAGLGGIFYSHDGGDEWKVPNLMESGSFNVLFTDIDVKDNTVAAVAMLADPILPADQQGVLTGVLFLSEDGGEKWIDASFDAPFHAATGVVVGEDELFVAAIDGGLFSLEGETWSHLGGPGDALAIGRHYEGIDVASATRGIWRYADGSWTHAGDGAVVAISGGLALGHDGSLYELVEGEGEAPPEPAGGTVHIALSFHTNFYHSYRGDTLDDDGFGMDLRLMRRVLDWLDEYPGVKADWDIENAFSLDDWLPEHGPDIIARIRERREQGLDGIRLMSWNNGVMPIKTREEFEASVTLGLESYVAAFGSYDQGVQPQECMITPEQLGWYRDLGIEWITLFNSGSSFTALRPEIKLSGRALYNPVLLRGSLETDGEMVLIPVYHQADILAHGGLAAWARQISDTHAGDSLLVIHMDVDAEVWEEFDKAIEQVYDLDFIRFTTIQEYVDAHETVETITLHGDLADGMDDAFKSWAEKNFNFELFTQLAVARRNLEVARVIAGEEPEVRDLLDAALEPILLSMSTTHFGLATPHLHPDRVASARAHVEAAEAIASEALDAALSTLEPGPGEILVINSRSSAGPALVRIPLSIPSSDWNGPEGLRLLGADRSELPALVKVLEHEPSDAAVPIEVTTVVDVDSYEMKMLHFEYDPSDDFSVEGEVDADLLSRADVISLAFTECSGARTYASAVSVDDVHVDDSGMKASREEVFDLALCGAAGTVVRTAIAYDGLPGVVVDLEASLGTPTRPLNAESVVLTPIVCETEVSELTWRTFAGTVRSRPARTNVSVWNGQTVDGWLSMRCGDVEHQVAHHVATRTSMAAYPLRNTGGTALLAPLGTLWGEPGWHDVPGLGGHPIGDAVVTAIGAQFRPSAPDWGGNTVRYRLLIGEGEISADVMDLFAHPPVVLTGG